MDVDSSNGESESLILKKLRLITPDHMQWSVIIDFITDLTANYDALKAHFSKIAESESCFQAKILSGILGKESTSLYLKVMQPIMLEVSRLRTLFKLNENQNVKVCDRVEEFFLSLAAQVLDPANQEKTVTELCEVDIHEKGIGLPSSEVKKTKI